MSNVYLYAVKYDLGFAPNPFNGLCSLACCKPAIRNGAQVGDWIVGLTGTKLKPALRCVFAMVVTKAISFDEYWLDPEYETRKANRAGTSKTQVGDNIYHRPDVCDPWHQEDSVHSLPSGQQSNLNTAHDTRVNRVLLSDDFVYLGAAAPMVPKTILAGMGYARNPRDMRKFTLAEAAELLGWLRPQLQSQHNMVVGDPIDFDAASKYYDYKAQKLV